MMMMISLSVTAVNSVIKIDKVTKGKGLAIFALAMSSHGKLVKDRHISWNIT